FRITSSNPGRSRPRAARARATRATPADRLCQESRLTQAESSPQNLMESDVATPGLHAGCVDLPAEASRYDSRGTRAWGRFVQEWSRQESIAVGTVGVERLLTATDRNVI